MDKRTKEEGCGEPCPCPDDQSIADCKMEPVCVCPNEDNKIKELPDSQYEEDKPIGILSEDHPLLQKFQQSLNAHLLKVQKQLMDEISDLNHNIQRKEKEREDVGSKLYDLQQEICHQNSLLDDFARQIKEVNEKRINHEKSVEISRKEYEDKLAMNKEEKRHHNERLMELSSLQNLENNIQKWAKEIEDEVNAAKRIVSKDSQDQQMISTEKKKVDLLIFNLDTEVRKREQELEGINNQMIEQNGVLDVLRNSLSDATADLEALQQEQNRLRQAWGEVIVAIRHRDKLLNEAKENLRTKKEKYKLLCANIEGSKKEASKEMEQNEKLEVFKTRILEDLKTIKRQLDKEDDSLYKYEQKLLQLEALTKETDSDMQLAKQEGNALEVQLRSIQYKLDKQTQKKVKLEEDILKLAQDQITADKASQYRMKLLRDAQDIRRGLELSMSQTENSVSSALLDVEKWKGIVIKLKEENEYASRRMSDTNAELDYITNEVKATENATNLKIKQIEHLSKKLDTLVRCAGGEESTPVDLKIKGLERQIQETDQQIRSTQQFWLTLQGHVVHLSEKRSTQLNELQIARKQVMVIDQKTLKTNLELQEAVNQGQELARNITKLATKLDLLGAKLFERKKMHQTDEVECHYVHFELVEKLRESEMDVLHVEQEIIDLTKEIEQYKIIVLERHREALSWETKYKMTEEIARWRRSEHNNDSEIANMKTEIRRMEVRYNQLKRAQEKLVQDLEYCVMHREKIFVTAMTRQKIEGNQTRSRSTIQHKLNEIKNKLKMIHNEIGATEKNQTDINNGYEQLIQEICKKESEIENEKMQDKLIQAEIEEGMLMKHRNLENIVRKQHRARRYRTLACCKALPKLKTEAIIERDMCKQMEINDNLTDISQHLLNGFPEKKFYITRILQTLRDD